MPFWLLKASVSPVCRLAIVSVAPVKSASKDDAVMPESTATAEWPSVNVCPVLPEAVTMGAEIATLTLSDAVLLLSDPSLATIESDRVVVLLLVAEKVTDSRAVWYWATVAVPLKVKTPVPLL